MPSTNFFDEAADALMNHGGHEHEVPWNHTASEALGWLSIGKFVFIVQGNICMYIGSKKYNSLGLFHLFLFLIPCHSCRVKTGTFSLFGSG